MANLIHSNQILYPLSGSFSGSLQGTASNAISSSFASTASYYGGSVTSASYAATASYVTNAQTASYVLNAISSSYAATASYYSGSVSNAISASYAISSSYSATSNYAGSSSFATSASYSSTASYVLNAVSASYASTASYYGGSVTSASYATTASYIQAAQTASYVLNAVSSSYATTASYALNGGGGATFPYSGSAVISGSLLITGSGLTVTGSVQVAGNSIIAGYSEYLPINTSINQSISASYIYVSGSTQDLYFSQNGSGYANTTRLRWLEGNLYSGLLNGGLITTQSSTVYQVASGSGIIVNLNASLTNNPFPTVQYLNWSNLSSSIAPLSASYDQTFIAINSSGQINSSGTPYYDGQIDTLIPLGIVLHQNHSTINGVKTQPSLAYGWKQRSNIFVTAFGPLKLSGHTLAVSGSSTGSLVVAGGTSFADGANYQTDPNNPAYVTDNGTSVSKIYRYYQSGSGNNNWVYNTNNGAGYGTIDPTQYSNNGVLTAVPGGGANRQWSIQRVFWYPNSVTKAIVVYYGNAIYTTQADAIANISIESFVEAPNTAANAIYVGALIVRNNANFTDNNSYSIVPGGLFRQVGGSGGGGSVITQRLDGLSDVNVTEGSGIDKYALVYDNSTAKWIASNNLGVSITGNAVTATTSSYAATASYVLNAVSSSYAGTASLAPDYVLTSVTASMLSPYVLTSQTSSMSVATASYASTSSYAPNYTLTSATGSFATTGSNNFNGNQTITGSLNVTGSNTLIGTKTITGSVFITGSKTIIGTNTITGSLNVSGSTVLNGPLTIGGSNITTAIITSNSGSNTIFTQATGSYTSAFYKYTFTSQSNARAGEVMAIWNGSSIQFTDNSTPDIGDTSAVTSSALLSGSNVVLSTYTPSGSWTLKSYVTYI
jgi:hypothetical protein